MQYLNELTKLLALEYNCSPKDFLRFERENVLTVSALKRGRRMYSNKKYFFHMCTLGGNAVITADECLHPFLSEFMRDKPGYSLFEMSNLHLLEAELNRFGHTLTDSHHMFLPHERVDSETLKDRVSHNLLEGGVAKVVNERIVGALFGKSDLPLIKRISSKNFDLNAIVNEILQVNLDSEECLKLEWFSEAEIPTFYGHPLLKNAILKKYTPKRPDRRLLCAYIGDELIGAAGCSEDAKNWMQIGVDVAEAYRSKGIGSLLVNMLKNELLDELFIPFYGTGISNYRSWNVALNCGFRPAWVEIGAKKL